MRHLIISTILTLVSVSAFAKKSPCLEEAQKQAPQRVKTLASEVMTIKAELELVGDSPYFTIAGDISEEKRAELISSHSLVPGDMLWPLDVIIDKKVAQENGLGEDTIAGFGGFLIIRCKSNTSSEIEKMWYQKDVVASGAEAAAE